MALTCSVASRKSSSLSPVRGSIFPANSSWAARDRRPLFLRPLLCGKRLESGGFFVYLVLHRVLPSFRGDLWGGGQIRTRKPLKSSARIPTRSSFRRTQCGWASTCGLWTLPACRRNAALRSSPKGQRECRNGRFARRKLRLPVSCCALLSKKAAFLFSLSWECRNAVMVFQGCSEIIKIVLATNDLTNVGLFVWYHIVEFFFSLNYITFAK